MRTKRPRRALGSPRSTAVPAVGSSISFHVLPNDRPWSPDYLRRRKKASSAKARPAAGAPSGIAVHPPAFPPVPTFTVRVAFEVLISGYARSAKARLLVSCITYWPVLSGVKVGLSVSNMYEYFALRL